MALDSIRKRAAEALTAALEAAFDHRLDEVALEVPPRRELGDLAWPGALPLARELRCAPRQIAEAVADKISAYQDRYPGRPVHLVGLCAGCGRDFPAGL